MVAPLVEWERANRKAMKSEVDKAKARAGVLTSKVKKLKGEAAGRGGWVFEKQNLIKGLKNKT